MPGTILATKIESWRKLIDQIRPLLETNNPNLTAEHANLEATVREVQLLDDRAEGLRGERQQLNRLRREAEAKAGEARARLAGLLVGPRGPKNEMLINYGLIPRPREVRRKAKKGTEPAGVPAAPAPTPTPET